MIPHAPSSPYRATGRPQIRAGLGLLLTCPFWLAAAAQAAATASSLPTPLDRYQDPASGSLWQILAYRADVDPFNIVALAIFVSAILHTFFTAKIRHWAHVVEARHAARLEQIEQRRPAAAPTTPAIQLR